MEILSVLHSDLQPISSGINKSLTQTYCHSMTWIRSTLTVRNKYICAEENKSGGFQIIPGMVVEICLHA